MSYFEKAKEKINQTDNGLTGAAKSVYSYVQSALLDFCKQEDEFAQAIVQSDKSISDCCKDIMKSCGNHISDIEVYRRAVEYFFPGAKVEFQMKIDLIGDVSNSTSKIFKVNFTDLL